MTDRTSARWLKPGHPRRTARPIFTRRGQEGSRLRRSRCGRMSGAPAPGRPSQPDAEALRDRARSQCRLVHAHETSRKRAAFTAQGGVRRIGGRAPRVGVF